jgi:hypothetical protein
MEKAEIFELLEKEMYRQANVHPRPIVRENESAEVKAIAHYLWLTDMLAVLISEVGEVGKALQGEKELEGALIKVSGVCTRWLENLK